MFALLSEPLHQVNALFDNIGEEIYDGIWMTAFGFRFSDNFTLTLGLDKDTYVERTGLSLFETKDGASSIRSFQNLSLPLVAIFTCPYLWLPVLLVPTFGCAVPTRCVKCSSTNNNITPGITRMTPAIKSDMQLEINGQKRDLLQTGQTAVITTADGPVTLWFPEEYVRHSDDENDGPVLFITTPFLDVRGGGTPCVLQRHHQQSTV